MEDLSKILTNNEEFLDKVALFCMQGYMSKRPPEDSNECVAICRISYRVAMAMLSVKLNELDKIAKKEQFFHNYRLKTKKDG